MESGVEAAPSREESAAAQLRLELGEWAPPPSPARTHVLGHWHALIEGLQVSPKEFYAAVEPAIVRREIPEATPSRVDWREAGFTSARREYLRLSRGRHRLDICGAPFGNGFFVSWWLAELRPSAAIPTLVALGATVFGWYFFRSTFGLLGGTFATLVAFIAAFWIVGAIMSQGESEWDPYLLAVPVLGPLWERFFVPATYYRIDTALMFQEAVHQAVQDVVDGFTKAQGLRALTELERKPILREFYRGAR